jgi:DNA-directed RNA polymerase specialized sigma24 family protein
MSDDKELLEYFSLIKKTTSSIRKRSFYDHVDVEEDVAHEAFIKLFENGFFKKNDHVGRNSYIYRTVHNCFIDKLKGLGVIRNLTKAERLKSDNKYENIHNVPMDEIDDYYELNADTLTPDGIIDATEAYQWIKLCFDSVYNEIKDTSRQKFFDTAFWWQNDIGLPIKDLAQFVGYKTSNPTQELKRLIEKVSGCTEPHGVTVVNPHEQIQFLQEYMVDSEVAS